tara:strand:+ start:546 stop:2699 length:2154 start_codon:yes stop_codon:yes gene_type:complete
MPSIELIDRPFDTFVSVYEPIKFSVRIGTTNVAVYPSCRVRIIPYDSFNDVFEYNKEVQIRVQAQPKPPTNIDQDGYAATSQTFYSGDVSSICRDFVSFDLRPCNQDTTLEVRRDISQGVMMLNTQKRFSVIVISEKIVNGQLVDADDVESKEFKFTAINSALSNEEQHASYIDNELASEDVGDNFVNGGFFRRYLHQEFSSKHRLAKYLTLKPTNKRYIGEDECEYLSMLVQRSSDDEYPYLQIRFFDLNGSQISGTLINLEAIAVGNGTYSDSPLEHRVDGIAKEERVMVQFGVGTRNIKETIHGLVSADDGVAPLVGDFRYISRYEIRSYFTQDGDDPQIGETVTYYINHSTTNIGTTRFHWQNRLGGIDSYTFEDTMIKSIMTSSSTFEQTIYPKFGDQLGESTTTNFYFNKALQERTGGVTSDQYHSVAKSNIKSYRNGQAISRPISNSEIPMMEDLLSSPRVWIEGGWIGKEVFRDNFDSLPTSANWDLVQGSFDLASVTTSDNHIAGSGNIVIGDNSGNDELWISSKSKIPYDPNKVYEIEIRTKRSGDGDGATYCGVTGFAADKTTKISTTGGNNFFSAHYATLLEYDQVSDDEWETWRGYITGHDTSGFSNQRNDVNNALPAYEGIKFISPMLLVGYADEETITQVDYIKVTEYESDLPNSERWYSTLNRNYYIPVVVKDSTTTMYDSNNMQKITLDYMHSKEQKTLK